MNYLKWLFGVNEPSLTDQFIDNEIQKFKSEMDEMTERNKNRNDDKIKELYLNLDKFGTTSKLDWIEGKDLFGFVSRNWYMNGEQLFEVVNKQTGDRFLAHYYSTENSFVNPLDPNEWFYDKESDWENHLNDYKAIPVFINYK